MSFDKLTVQKGQGGLGRTSASEDGVAGLVVQAVGIPAGTGISGIALLEPKKLLSTRDASDLGITETYDKANGLLVRYHIDCFFDLNPTGELWIMLVDRTLDWVDLADHTLADSAVKLLKAAEGKIRLLGIAFNPEDTYTGTAQDGLDSQIWDTINAAQLLANDEWDKHRPVEIFVEGRMFNGTAAAAKDLHTLNSESVYILIGSDASPDFRSSLANDYAANDNVLYHAAIGTLLGRLASSPVNESPAYMEKGDIQNVNLKKFLSPGLSNNEAVAPNWDDYLGVLNGKGYIFCFKDTDAVGTYFSNGYSCTALTSDYFCVENNRTINKAHKGIRKALLPKTGKPVLFNKDGTIARIVIEDLKVKGKKPLSNMVAAEEISDFALQIDPLQEVQQTRNMEVEFSIVTTGTMETITAKINLAVSI